MNCTETGRRPPHCPQGKQHGATPLPTLLTLLAALLAAAVLITG